jgi:hypothetical protein
LCLVRSEEDEAQISVESLQAEVNKFLTPAARNGLEPLCGHSHQLSFIAVNSTRFSLSSRHSSIA